MKTIYGGGGVEWTRTAKRNVCRDATASGPAQPASDWSRNQALPASTLSPARHLTALPSRQVAGSSPDAPDFDYFRAHSYADLAGGF